MEMSPKKRRTAEERRRVLLEAAAVLFLASGYDATTLEAIIERAGGSRRDIYAEFGNKEGLFAALIEETVQRAIPHVSADVNGTKSIREILLTMMQGIAELVFSPVSLAMFRVVVGDCTRFPELAKKYFEFAPEKIARTLATVLEAAKKRGEIADIDTNMAAEFLLSAVRGHRHLHVAMRLRQAPDKEEMHLLVTNAVDCFLNGVTVSAGAMRK